ncbi:MAG TPA: TonB family protein [Polyangiaceae bacterium]
MNPVVRRTSGRCRAALLAGCILAYAQSAQAQEPSHAVVPPVVVSHVDAVYPPSALPTREHADVVLLVTVDTDGHVSKADVAESSGAPDLDEAALVAVRQWTFVPAKRDGKPVASRIKIPFHFAPPAPPPEVVPPPPTNPSTLPEQQSVPQQPSAPAQPAAPAVPTPSTTGAEIEEVHVQGRATPPSVGASDFNLHVGNLANVPRANASEMLKLAPGILLTNEGGEGHAEQVFLRGFDAREGQDIEFTVGGVPINESGNLHGNGYADTHFIIPELVQQLRVVEGPFDPRQGNYAVAGSADYQLGLEKRGLTAKYTGGSFNTQRMLVMWGPPGESEHTFAAAEVYKTDGFGQNRSAQRGTAYAQYEGNIGSRGTWRVTGQVYTTDYHSAGVIREDDYEAGRIGFYDTYNPQQGGDSFRTSLAADIETRTGDTTLGQQLFIIKRTMRLREDFTGYLLDVQQPWQTPHDQRGDLIDMNVDEMTLGARGFARLEGKMLGQTQGLELGYFARYDQAAGQQQRVDPTTLDPYLTETNLQSNLGDVGIYGALDLHPLSWIALRGGLRADVFTFDVNNLCAHQSIDQPNTSLPPPLDTSCMSEVEKVGYVEPNQRVDSVSTAVLPKASVILGPFEHLTFSASYGQGVRSIDPGYITQDVATPFASINAYEGGAAYTGPVGPVTLVARSVFFDTHVDKDYIFDQTVGRNVLGVGTTRTGWVGALRATGDWFDESANVTFVRSTYDDSGLLVPYIPDVVVRSDTAVWSDLPWRLRGDPFRGALSAGVTYVGERPLPFGAVSGTIFTLDANATLAWSHYEIGLIVTNLLDTRYRLGEFNYASNFNPIGPGAPSGPPSYVPSRLFTAGAPRAVFGTFAINFGGA